MQIDIEREFNSLRRKKETLQNSEQLQQIIYQTLFEVDSWKVSDISHVFDIEPDISEQYGLYKLDNDDAMAIQEGFVSLAMSANNQYYSYGFNNDKHVLTVPPISKVNTNKVFCYQYKHYFVDRLNIGSLAIHLDENKLMIDSSKHLPHLDGILRVFESNHKQIISLSLLRDSGCLVTTYLYDDAKNITEINTRYYDDGFNITNETKQYLTYKNGQVSTIINKEGLQVFSRDDYLEDNRYLFDNIFKYLTINDKQKLNKILREQGENYDCLCDFLKGTYKTVEYEELEEAVFESILAIQGSLTCDNMFIQYINSAIGIDFKSWDDLDKFITVLYNVAINILYD